MFKNLCQNPEIHSYLQSFPLNYLKTALEAACLFGIRKLIAQDLPITLKTTEEILNPSNPLKKTLKSMKNDIKSLTVAIKRIERRTQSSTDLIKDFSLSSEKSRKSLNDCVARNSISSSANFNGDRKGIGFNQDEKRLKQGSASGKKEVKEPKCCTIIDAKKIFLTVQSERRSLDMMDKANDFFRSRASHSTQDTSVKGFNSTLSSVNMTFGK